MAEPEGRQSDRGHKRFQVAGGRLTISRVILPFMQSCSLAAMTSICQWGLNGARLCNSWRSQRQNLEGTFQRYERLPRPLISSKQKAAEQFAGSFAPRKGPPPASPRR